MGARIKGLREATGRSYESFAIKYGISRSRYWEWEQGCNITWKNIKRIAEIHGLSIPEFFSEGFEEEG